MAGASWTFTVSPDTITEVTITDGVTTVTVQATGGGMIVPFFETSAFPETTDVTISATGYNDVTAVVGTTSSVTFTEASTTPTVAYLSDGTNTYEIEDSKARAAIQTLLSNIYPVGSVYIGTQSTCPMSTVMSGTTWTLVSSGKALWTGNGTNGNSTIAAGIPNHIHLAGNNGNNQGWFVASNNKTAISFAQAKTSAGTSGTTQWNGKDNGGGFTSNPNTVSGNIITTTAKTAVTNNGSTDGVYGKSTTVQPPAYVVNVWRRTA